MTYPNEDYYKSKWKKIVNVLLNQNLGISKIAQAGSRARHSHHQSSDMDVIFSVSGNPNKNVFYPELLRVLQNNFPNDNVFPGTSYNVVHLNISSGGKFDFVLLNEWDFDSQHKNIIQYRRNTL